MAMGPFGLHYERTQTWWEQSKPWHEYLARCQYLLQQGLFVADICYLAPEKSPQRWQPPRPALERPGYNFDGCPPEVLLTRMSVKDGKLVLPDGMSYRLLVLPDSATMTPRLLGRIKDLVEAGATVLGPRPRQSASLSDYPRCDAEVRRLAEELWGDCDGKAVTEHRLGKGRVVWGPTPQRVLSTAGVLPDFAAQTKETTHRLRYIHKTAGDVDLYFVSNPRPESQDALCAFRVMGKVPELWSPDSGRIERAAIRKTITGYKNESGITCLPIHFDPAGSVFVVFRPSQTNGIGPIVSLARDGKGVVDASPHPDTIVAREVSCDVSNTFTMAVWAKPDADIDLPHEAAAGSAGLNLKRNDALYPPPGQEIYFDGVQAGAGLSIGRNGVCVFEHGCGHFAPVLAFACPITNWTHFAVAYRDGKPSLYLNGKLVHEGLKSGFVVHPGVGLQHWRNPAPFAGAMGQFQKFDILLTDAEVAYLAQSSPIPGSVAVPQPPELFRNRKGNLEAQVWRPGIYEAKNEQGGSMRFDVENIPEPLAINGPWDLRFPAGWGAPERGSLDNLISWSDHADPGVKYFSGTATYAKTITLPPNLFVKAQRLYLDLGRVAVIAQVTLNGKNLGTLWKPPFCVEITAAAKPGQNALEVKVVNLWINRMIGDEQLPEDSERDGKGALEAWPEWLQDGRRSPSGRYAFTTWRLWKKDSPLQPSGLLGPVRIVAAKELVIPSFLP
jgi:hypothetical protein